MYTLDGGINIEIVFGLTVRLSDRQTDRLSKKMMERIHTISPVPSKGIHTYTQHAHTQKTPIPREEIIRSI